MEGLLRFVPSVGALTAVIVALVIVRRLLDWNEAKLSGKQFRNQIIMMVMSAAGLLIVILVIPMGDVMRGQVLSLLGILLSAAIALSATTVLGNAMAGMMMRAVRNFRMGDFIRTGEHFGRVSERGLFHTEIQTEDRELTTIPNLYLVTHPVTTTRASGTIVSARISLGYDVPRTKIEPLLLEAAKKADLSDPYVHVLKLGDFAVTYRIAGMLVEVKRILSARSSLRKRVMDSLHESGVMIVSPTFMNTRALPEEGVVLPQRSYLPVETEPEAAPEDLVFDKAEEAESLENLRLFRAKVLEEVEATEKSAKEAPEGPAREKVEHELSVLTRRKERLDKVISSRESKAAKSE